MLREPLTKGMFLSSTLALVAGCFQEARPALSPAAVVSDAVRVAGRLDPTSVRAVGGSRVQVFQLAGDGRGLERVSVDSAPVEDDGRFEVAVNASRLAQPDLLVVAEHEGFEGRGMVLISSWASVEGLIIASPIDVETAVESDAFIAASRGGFLPPHFATNEIRALITRRMAAKVRASPNYQRDVALLSQASVAAIEAWYRVLLVSPAAVEHVKVALETRAWAQVALDAQLYDAENSDEQAQARSLYDAIVTNAYASLGIGPDHLAAAAQAAADAMIASAEPMSPAARAMLRSEAESLRARYVTNAVDALMVQAGVESEERQAVRGAGEELEGRILSAGNREDADRALRDAWRDYRRAVKGRLESIAASAVEVI